MTTFLDVETADFVQAAQSMAHDVGDPAGDALLRLQFGLGDCAQMAGRDPGGAAWAAAYDRAAAAALTAAADVVDATYRVGAMFAQTARNYAAADAASGGHPAHVDAVAAPMHDAAPCLRPPSAAGGSGGTPAGWFLVENTVGRVWPDGHQDPLHAAAGAWSHAAAGLRDAASWTVLSDVAFDRDRLPEADDMNVVCMSVGSHLHEVAGVFDQLGDSCRDLAHHIDVAHSEIEHELASLAGQSAAIEVGGALLSVVTAGASELVAQGVEAGRLAAVANRIRDLIDLFTAAARAVSMRVAAAADRAVQVAARARVLLGARLSAAELAVAGRYPRLAQAVRERMAIYRLEGDAGQVVLRKMGVSLAQAERKFKHAADLGVTNLRGRGGFEDFRIALQSFVRSPSTARIDGFYRGEPAILSWSRKRMVLVIQHPDGGFWTCFTMTGEQLSSIEARGRVGFE